MYVRISLKVIYNGDLRLALYASVKCPGHRCASENSSSSICYSKILELIICLPTRVESPKKSLILAKIETVLLVVLSFSCILRQPKTSLKCINLIFTRFYVIAFLKMQTF